MLTTKASDSINKLVTKTTAKKKLKKQKVLKKWQEDIDEPLSNVDQVRNLPPTIDIDEKSDVCNGQLVTKAATKKEKRKKQKLPLQRKDAVIHEPPFNVNQLRGLLPTTDIDNEETIVSNGKLASKAVIKKRKLKKQKGQNKLKKEANVEPPFNIDQCRNPLEDEEHWGLRRAFLEKNQHVLPPDELITFTQVYMNVELLGCRYVPETMEMVAKLSEGLGRDYYRSRALMLKRTFVSASDAAVWKVRRLNPEEVAKQCASTSVDAADQKGSVPSRVLNSLRSDLIIFNNDLRSAFERFNLYNHGMKIAASAPYFRDDIQMYEGVVTVGDFEIARGQNSSTKRALQKAMENAKIFLSQYCYSISRKTKVSDLTGVEVVSKSELAVQEDPEASKLDTKNVGFKLLEKLGWNGGSLGVRGNGIMDPVTIDQKQGREGLGLEAQTLGKLSQKMILQKLKDFGDGTIDEDKIVFSSECSKEERKLIHSIANNMNLKTQSYGNESKGGRYLVVTRKHQLRPIDLLRKVLVEKDPTFCRMYDITYPSELQ